MDPTRGDFAETAAGLAAGGVYILQTDTLPGLHGRADDPAAVERIFRMKGRPEGKPALVLAGSLEMAFALVEDLDDRVASLCRRCWPGPYSLILPGRPGLAAGVRGPDGTLAVRVPACAELRRLIEAAGGALVSTSANLTGRPPCRTVREALAEMGDGVDGAWAPDPGQESDPGTAPSALVDATVWPPQVLREGPGPLPLVDPDAS
ncbi:MAG: L-threonylcarbamoyladenylate synthase [Candidatus Krumholzibacteriia bacterium]